MASSLPKQKAHLSCSLASCKQGVGAQLQHNLFEPHAPSSIDHSQQEKDVHREKENRQEHSGVGLQGAQLNS
jgi:hypothetical protein